MWPTVDKRDKRISGCRSMEQDVVVVVVLLLAVIVVVVGVSAEAAAVKQ